MSRGREGRPTSGGHHDVLGGRIHGGTYFGPLPTWIDPDDELDLDTATAEAVLTMPLDTASGRRNCSECEVPPPPREGDMGRLWHRSYFVACHYPEAPDGPTFGMGEREIAPALKCRRCRPAFIAHTLERPGTVFHYSERVTDWLDLTPGPTSAIVIAVALVDLLEREGDPDAPHYRRTLERHFLETEVGESAD